MATIQDNINRIKQAKADIKEAIIAKGVEMADDVRIDGYAEKIGEIQQGGGGSQFAIDYGEEIYTNNAYSMTAEQEDIDYYNQIQAERAAYAAGTGGRSDAEIFADPIFKEKIAWWPKGMKRKDSDVMRFFYRLRELIEPTMPFRNINYLLADCINLKNVEIDATTSTRGSYFFNNCYTLEKVIANFDNITEATYMYGNCVALKDGEFPLNYPKITTMTATFLNCKHIVNVRLTTPPLENVNTLFNGCTNLELLEVNIGGKMQANGLTNVFFGTNKLKVCHLVGWNSLSLSIPSPVLEPESVHYILFNTEDATARKLTLNATAKANWEASEYYEEDVARAQELNITIA